MRDSNYTLPPYPSGMHECAAHACCFEPLWRQWPEVLRGLLLYLDSVEEEPLEGPLKQLAVHLGTEEYHTASIELKALALAALCDRLVTGEPWSILLDQKYDEVEHTTREIV